MVLSFPPDTKTSTPPNFPNATCDLKVEQPHPPPQTTDHRAAEPKQQHSGQKMWRWCVIRTFRFSLPTLRPNGLPVHMQRRWPDLPHGWIQRHSHQQMSTPHHTTYTLDVWPSDNVLLSSSFPFPLAEKHGDRCVQGGRVLERKKERKREREREKGRRRRGGGETQRRA